MIRAAPGVTAASRRRSGGGGTPTVLGYDTLSGTQVLTDVKQMFVSKFTLASPGTLTALHAYLQHDSGTVNVRLFVYADSAGAPGALVAYTSSLPVTVGTPTDISETGLSVALVAAPYWIGLISDTTGARFYHAGNGTGTHAAVFTAATYTPPPSSFGTPDLSGTRKFSFWAIVNI